MKNELTELSHKVKTISTKGFTKDLVNPYKGDNISIFYYKYFYSGMLQNYFLLIPAKNKNKYFSGTTDIYSWKIRGISEESIENINKRN